MAVKNFEQYHKLNENDNEDPRQMTQLELTITSLILELVEAGGYYRIGREVDMIESLVDYDWEAEYSDDNVDSIVDSNIPIFNSEIFECYANHDKLTFYADEALEQGLVTLDSGILKIAQIGIYEYLREIAQYVIDFFGLTDEDADYEDNILKCSDIIEEELNRGTDVSKFFKWIKDLNKEFFKQLLLYMKSELPKNNLELYKKVIQYLDKDDISDQEIKLALDATKHRESGLF